MTEPKNDPTTIGHEQHAGAPVPADDEFTDAAPAPGGEHAGFTPRRGESVDGGWRPDEHPHGEPDPGPSIEDDPGVRGPEARSALAPRQEPVPPEIEDPEFRTPLPDDGDPDES